MAVIKPIVTALILCVQLSGALRAATPEGGEKHPLPRVLVIGDSISEGYIKPLAELLKDKAAVERPRENCGSSRRILDHLDQFLGDTRWDVIQFNCGIHDLRYLNAERKPAAPKDGGKHQVPLDEYRANLNKIVDRLKKTRASLIWCSTTPLNTKVPYWVADDVARYYEVAAEVMRNEGVPIADLNAKILKRGTPKWSPDGVHFTPEGSQELAEELVPEIGKTLSARTRR